MLSKALSKTISEGKKEETEGRAQETREEIAPEEDSGKISEKLTEDSSESLRTIVSWRYAEMTTIIFAGKKERDGLFVVLVVVWIFLVCVIVPVVFFLCLVWIPISVTHCY